MPKQLLLVLGASVAAEAGQAFQMDMEEVVSWGGMVLVARVDSVGFRWSYEEETIDFHIMPISSLVPHEYPLVPFDGTYTRLEPAVFLNEDGDQFTEWPLVTGSGMEDEVEAGDTVLVFMRSSEILPDGGNSVLRIETMESVQALVDHLVEIAD